MAALTPQHAARVDEDNVVGAASSSITTTDGSRHALSESEARHTRKLAAALRQPPRPDAIDVNASDSTVLLQRLARVRKLPNTVARRIVELRPFASRTDLVFRINAGST